MPRFESIWDVTPETAHPRARQLINQSVIWDYGDEDSPLGTDTGADAFAAYLEFRNSNPDRSAGGFTHEQLAWYEFSDKDWDLTDPAEVERVLHTERGIELLRRDDFIVGLAFAQLLLEGSLNPEIKRLAITALRRQGMDVVLEFRGGGENDARKRQLAAFQKILEAA